MKQEAIEKFRERYRLKISRDECGDPVIRGRRSATHHIFDNGDGRLGICLAFDGHPAKWTFAKQKAGAAGLAVHQDGYGEGTMLFDPADSKQARMALRLTGARIKRVLTPEQRQALAGHLRTAREAITA